MQEPMIHVGMALRHMILHFYCKSVLELIKSTCKYLCLQV